jgi:hypothetical protein
MDRLRRTPGRVLCALVGVAASIALATAAVARGEIPRPPGAVDNRGYELVSQPDKAQNGVVDALASADGNRVYYILFGGAPGTTTGDRPLVLATRTSSGWTSSTMMPPRTDMVADGYALTAATPDLSSWIASAFDGIGQPVPTPDETLVRLTDTGAQTLLHTFPTFFGPNGVEAAASLDLDHVFVNAPEQIDPSHQPRTSNLYDFGSGTPELVSRMPASGLAPTCGLGLQDERAFVTNSGSTGEHWASEDGARVFFLTRGDDAPACDNPWQLYMRDLDASLTTRISGPTTARGADVGIDRFLRAGDDGSWVVFRAATSYDATDDDDGDSADADVYRWDDGAGLACLTCVVPHAAVGAGDQLSAAVSEDGSRVYFTSAEQLADAPAPATVSSPNIYVARSGAVHFVARTDGRLTHVPPRGGDLTPDGRVLIFVAAHPSLNTPSANNGGLRQVYRYDDVDDSLTCLSCPPGGAPASAEVPLGLLRTGLAVPPDTHMVTDDGARAFFRTDEALVPEDVNGGGDIYEWHAGVLSLITDGVTLRPPAAPPGVVSVSGDGRDMLFVDSARLTADARDGAQKLYDARAGGGFEPPPPPPAGCLGEGCRGSFSVPPSLLDADSGTGVSGGNVVAPGEVRFTMRKLTRMQRSRLARTGRGIVTVRVSGATQISLRAQAMVSGRVRMVARARRRTAGARTVALPVRLSKAARTQLAGAGRLELVLVVRITNSTASPQRLVAFLRP